MSSVINSAMNGGKVPKLNARIFGAAADGADELVELIMKNGRISMKNGKYRGIVGGKTVDIDPNNLKTMRVYTKNSEGVPVYTFLTGQKKGAAAVNDFFKASAKGKVSSADAKEIGERFKSLSEVNQANLVGGIENKLSAGAQITEAEFLIAVKGTPGFRTLKGAPAHLKDLQKAYRSGDIGDALLRIKKSWNASAASANTQGRVARIQELLGRQHQNKLASSRVRLRPPTKKITHTQKSTALKKRVYEGEFIPAKKPIVTYKAKEGITVDMVPDQIATPLISTKTLRVVNTPKSTALKKRVYEGEFIPAKKAIVTSVPREGLILDVSQVKKIVPTRASSPKKISILNKSIVVPGLTTVTGLGFLTLSGQEIQKDKNTLILTDDSFKNFPFLDANFVKKVFNKTITPDAAITKACEDNVACTEFYNNVHELLRSNGTHDDINYFLESLKNVTLLVDVDRGETSAARETATSDIACTWSLKSQNADTSFPTDQVNRVLAEGHKYSVNWKVKVPTQAASIQSCGNNKKCIINKKDIIAQGEAVTQDAILSVNKVEVKVNSKCTSNSSIVSGTEASTDSSDATPASNDDNTTGNEKEIEEGEEVADEESRASEEEFSYDPFEILNGNNSRKGPPIPPQPISIPQDSFNYITPGYY